MRDHCSQRRDQSHDRWHIQTGKDRLEGLYTHHEMPKRAPHGYPLGGGHPKRVPKEFRNAYHSTREEQLDKVPDSGSETKEEEWDGIVAYDIETSRYTTVADQDHCIACNHHRTNKHRHRKLHPGYGKTKRLSLLIFQDSTSDNAITYDDWRRDVDNYVQGGHSPKLIRD